MVYEIVERVKCELAASLAKRSLDQRLKFLNGWAVTVDLNLLVDTSAGVNPGVSIINPLAPGESFTLGLGLGTSGRATRTEGVSFKLPVRDAWNEVASRGGPRRNDQALAKCHLKDTDRLNSDLGFDEWFVTILGPNEASVGDARLKHLTRISHEVSFVVSTNVSATPNWTLVKFRGPGLGSRGGGGSSGGGNNNSLLAFSRSDTHKLTMTLAPNTQKGDKDASDALILNRLQTIFVPQ